MNVAESVINFYLDVFKRDIVRTKNMIGFRNKFFVNPIMTPNFVLNKISDNEIAEQSLNIGTDDLWFNCFESFVDSSRLNKDVILSPEYIVETEIHNFDELELNYKVLDLYFGNSEKYQTLVCDNSYNLPIATQINILKVLSHSDSKVETFVASNKRDDICAGATLVHGKATSMLLNGFVDEEFRGTGLFKAFHANCKRRCFELGSSAVFYWTFNDKLKGKGQYCEKLHILR